MTSGRYLQKMLFNFAEYVIPCAPEGRLSWRLYYFERGITSKSNKMKKPRIRHAGLLNERHGGWGVCGVAFPLSE
jgi:hypothetical protein